MYFEVKVWDSDRTLSWLEEKCNLLDCATEDEIYRVERYIISHLCTDSNMQMLAEMVAGYSRPVCNMEDFVCWILMEISNHCVNRIYTYRQEGEREYGKNDNENNYHN